MLQELRIPTEIDLAAFISKEAHDLKSPFNRALGFIKLVLEGFDGPISEQAEEDLTVAYQNTQHTVIMMEALVDIARLGRSESDPILKTHQLSFILQQTITEWKRKYHKKNSVEITFSAPEVQILADEIMIRHFFAHWISYVNEFVLESASVTIQVEEQSDSCLFTIRSNGVKPQEPSECDLTLYGFVARGILDLHQGELIQLVEDDQGALVQFSLPKAT
ncbi:sensor histidine kinase [Chloroflexota bacterium]